MAAEDLTPKRRPGRRQGRERPIHLLWLEETGRRRNGHLPPLRSSEGRPNPRGRYAFGLRARLRAMAVGASIELWAQSALPIRCAAGVEGLEVLITPVRPGRFRVTRLKAQPQQEEEEARPR